MYDVVIHVFASFNRKIAVMSVLMKHMLCQRERSSVGGRMISVLMTGRLAMLAKFDGCERATIDCSFWFIKH